MARSRTIFIVERPGELPEGFTVKHELVTWLGRQPSLDPETKIWRCDDGLVKRPPRRVPLREWFSGRIG